MSEQSREPGGRGGSETPELEARRAAEVMVCPFVAASASATVAEVARLLEDSEVQALPLFETCGASGGRRWVGQTHRPELEAALAHGLGQAPVWQVSAQPPGWIHPYTDLATLTELDLGGRGRVWLVGDEKESNARGVLSLDVLQRYAGGSPAEPAASAAPARWISLQDALSERSEAVVALGQLAAERGHTAWLVGGGVRDLLLGRAVRDADVVVEADAPALARAAVQQLGGQLEIHGAFRTAKWRPPGWSEEDEPIDLASARGEVYPGRAQLPEVVLTDLSRDLFRRDFTLNAMAICLHPDRRGELLDPHGGWRDLRAGVLRVLHGLSFQDDPTRILRAARFAARFGMTLAEGSRRLVDGARMSGVFEELSAARLGAELDRLLDESEAPRALQLLRQWGLAPVLHPAWMLDDALLAELGSVQQALDAEEDLLSERPRRADVGWVLLTGGLAPTHRSAIQAMVPGNKLRRQRAVAGPDPLRSLLERLARPCARAEVARLLRPLDSVQWAVAVGLARGGDSPRAEEALRWWWREGRRLRSAIDGGWLQAQGHAPGPGFGKALARAQEVAWDGGDAAAQGQAAVEELLRTRG